MNSVVSRLKKAGKGEVPEAFKEQWKNTDRDGDGKENEPKPDFLKKKPAKKKPVPEAFKEQWKEKDGDGDGKINEPKPDFLKEKKGKVATTEKELDELASTLSLAQIQALLKKKKTKKASMGKAGRNKTAGALKDALLHYVKAGEELDKFLSRVEDVLKPRPGGTTDMDHVLLQKNIKKLIEEHASLVKKVNDMKRNSTVI